MSQLGHSEPWWMRYGAQAPPNSGDMPIPPSGYGWAPGACGSISITPVVVPICGYIQGGLHLSGVVSALWNYPSPQCELCGKQFPGTPTWGSGHDRITVPDAYGRVTHFCYECANYRPDLGRFENREDWLRETTPFTSGTHPLILADWLEDQGRSADAQWLRRRYPIHSQEDSL